MFRMAGIVALALCAASATVNVAAAGTLHIFCWGGATCVDNGTNAPTFDNPPKFGFTDTQTQTGDFLLDILVPNTQISNPAATFYNIYGGLTGTAHLVSTTAWTSGKLDAYLGVLAQPKNPIGAYLPSDLTLFPGATGFYVFQADLGKVTLSKSEATAQHLTSDSLIRGSYILAFLDLPNSGTDVATPNSNALWELGFPTQPATTTPLPASLPLFASGLAGLGFLRLRRARKTACSKGFRSARRQKRPDLVGRLEKAGITVGLHHGRLHLT